MNKQHLTPFVLFSFIFFTALIFSACENFFVPVNVPIVLADDAISKNPPPPITIDSCVAITPGVAQDISTNGSTIVLYTAGTTYDVNTYNTDTAKISSLVSSDKKILNILYDASNQGIYYIEKQVESQKTNRVEQQLVWSDINKNTTRVISLSDENVVQNFGVSESGHVVYANTNNQIVVSDSEGNSLIYDIRNNRNILAVDYISADNGFVFIASDSQSEERANLYYAKAKDNTSVLTSTLITENVSAFDIDEQTHQVVFTKGNGNTQTIHTWNANDNMTPPIASGRFGTIQFTPDGQKIIFTRLAPNSVTKAKSIWLMDIDGENAQQVTAPLNIDSKILCPPDEPILYFSIEEDSENPSPSESEKTSQTYQLTYMIN